MSLLLTVLVCIIVLYFWFKPRPKRARGNVSKSGNRVFYTQVHGITHRNSDGSSRQKIISECSEGEELALVPEPDNPFDPSAVKICRKNGQQLGYWQGDGRMAHDLAIGWTYRVTIDEIYPFQENHRKHGVRLRVEVLTMSQAAEAKRTPTVQPVPASPKKHSRSRETMKVIDPSTGRMECTVCGARHYADEGVRARFLCLHGCRRTRDGVLHRPLETPKERTGITTEDEVEAVRMKLDLSKLKNARHPLDKKP